MAPEFRLKRIGYVSEISLFFNFTKQNIPFLNNMNYNFDTQKHFDN